MGSDLQQAERASRTRSLIMAVMAVVLVIQGALGFGDEASSMTPWLRHGLWGVMILFWLVILHTGGWLRLSRRVRSLMNDEVTLANRSCAIEAGFWTAMAVGLIVYFASAEWQLSAREALRIVVNLTIAGALARYAWLELR